MCTRSNTFGNKLKQLRLASGIECEQICNSIGISPDTLKDIESGCEVPDWEKIVKFATLYQQDPEWLLAQHISDEAVKWNVQNDGKVVSESTGVAYSQRSLFEGTSFYNPYKLESRRYIGSKAKLIDWIMGVIRIESPNAHTFCDIFSGTGSVANRALDVYDKVIINDTLLSNNVIYDAFFGKGDWNRDKLCRILDEYNALKPEEVGENWFSKNYGGKFFSNDVAKMIGYVRQDIENRKFSLTEKEFNILLASLIYSIDRVANTVGHYDAYIKKTIKPQEFSIRLVNARSLDNVEIYQEDANKLAKRIKVDVVYLDPPYNSRQYCRFYHVYETLVKWNMPKLYGVALKPKPENMSLYCTSKAVDAFEDLVFSIDAKVIVVSYNNTYNSKSSSSKNKIRLSEIKQILDSCGTTTIYEHQHQFFNAGKTSFEDHKEFLFVTKIDDTKRDKSLSSLLRWG